MTPHSLYTQFHLTEITYTKVCICAIVRVLINFQDCFWKTCVEVSPQPLCFFSDMQVACRILLSWDTADDWIRHNLQTWPCPKYKGKYLPEMESQDVLSSVQFRRCFVWTHRHELTLPIHKTVQCTEWSACYFSPFFFATPVTPVSQEVIINGMSTL